MGRFTGGGNQKNPMRTSNTPNDSHWLLRSLLLAIIAAFLSGPAFAQNRLVSTFARKTPHLDGAPGWGEWDGAARIQFEHGYQSRRKRRIDDDAKLFAGQRRSRRVSDRHDAGGFSNGRADKY